MAKTTFNPVQKTKTQLYKENVKKESSTMSNRSDIDKLMPRYNTHPKYSLNKDHSLDN